MSGEVIVIRMGDRICLKCLRRLDYNEIAKEMSPDMNVRQGLVSKGYVTGADVKEPAVKTLNAIMGALTVDQLVNQYTRQHAFHPITVFENNLYPRIHNDETSILVKNKMCDVCDIGG
jgi:molybdopterin-synthase adenylyltransferase